MAVRNNKNFTEPDYYQPVVFYSQPIKVGFHTETITYPFYAPNVFLTEEDAIKFLSGFVKGLVTAGDLPEDTIKSDNTINEKRIRTAVVPILVTEMEIDDDQ